MVMIKIKVKIFSKLVQLETKILKITLKLNQFIINHKNKQFKLLRKKIIKQNKGL